MTDARPNVILCTCGNTLRLDFDSLRTAIRKDGIAGSVDLHDSLCQETGLSRIGELVAENPRLVIAACTSQKIRPRIEQYLTSKSLDSTQVYYVNIREHSAWVHPDITSSTDKSLDMIRGTVAACALSEPLSIKTKEVPRHVTVIGGGIAGIETALALTRLGYSVTIIEKGRELGGHLLQLPVVAPTGLSGRDILSPKLSQLQASKSINVMLGTRVKYFEGEMGAFSVHYVGENGEDGSLSTSAVVLATGFREFKPTMMDEYMYGRDEDVITQLELATMMTEGDLVCPSTGSKPREVIMVQCVGSRSQDHKSDCSKLCCTFAIDNALEIKKRVPEARVRIVYMDIRVPFESEMIYKESREKGVDYIRGRISQVWRENNRLVVRIYDSLLDRYFDAHPDLVVLSSAILPAEGLEELSQTLGFSIDRDGHVQELYGKLRRNETRRRGVVAVGAITRPQFSFEAVTDAHAAALLIHNELQGGHIEHLARGANLNVDECVGCSLCAQHCPRGVPLMVEKSDAESDEDKIVSRASIDIMNCHACGVCQSLCPSGATQLNFLSNEQLWAQIEATLNNAGAEYPKTLCFYCEECSVSTIDIVGIRRMEYPDNVRLVPVPCAGRVSLVDILKAFEQGASTVMVAACEKDRCHYGGTGNEIAQAQVDVAKSLLNAIGWDGDRVEMFRMFSAEPERFIHAVKEMVRRSHELGPTPVHKQTAGKWMEVVQ